jgi:hypothetical protein
MAVCESCGHAVEADALFCAHCGAHLRPASAPAPSHPDAALHVQSVAAVVGVSAHVEAPHAVADGNAITWPFQQEHWPRRLWILLLGWIPVLGWLPALTISVGWMLDATGRRGRGETDRLPRPRNIVQMFVHGIVYWLMLILYVAVPLWLFGAIFAAETAIIVDEFHLWVVNSSENATITGINVVALSLGLAKPVALVPQQDLLSLIQHWAVAYTAGFFVPLVWVAFASPVFAAASIRFAVTGQFRSYFRPIANIEFVLRHLFGFLWLFAVMIANLVVASLIPLAGTYLLFTVGLWIIAYYGGRLGAKLHLHP